MLESTNSQGGSLVRTKDALRFAGYAGVLTLALMVSTGSGLAQDAYVGKFTLSSEIYWGTAVLEPGDYTITMPSASAPNLIFLRGQNTAAIFFAVGSDSKAVSELSRLTLVEVDGKYIVRAFEEGDLGLVLDYRLPKAIARQMAQERNPKLSIPVSMSGK
jgi:hypothetical protein